MHMSRFLNSFRRISREGYGGDAAFDGVSMRRTHESHIFAISRQKHLYILLIRPAVVFFEKNDFFEKSGIPLYRRGRSPRFRSKSEMYTYYSTKMLCVKFQRSRATRMWPFDDPNSFFFAHFLASETQWGTHSVPAHLVPTHVWACVRSIHVKRARKYRLHEALRKISIFIGKSGFSGPAPT